MRPARADLTLAHEEYMQVHESLPAERVDPAASPGGDAITCAALAQVDLAEARLAKAASPSPDPDRGRRGDPPGGGPDDPEQRSAVERRLVRDRL